MAPHGVQPNTQLRCLGLSRTASEKLAIVGGDSRDACPPIPEDRNVFARAAWALPGEEDGVDIGHGPVSGHLLGPARKPIVIDRGAD
jgi:hypothetical protein